MVMKARLIKTHIGFESDGGYETENRVDELRHDVVEIYLTPADGEVFASIAKLLEIDVSNVSRIILPQKDYVYIEFA